MHGHLAFIWEQAIRFLNGGKNDEPSRAICDELPKVGSVVTPTTAPVASIGASPTARRNCSDPNLNGLSVLLSLVPVAQESRDLGFA